LSQIELAKMLKSLHQLNRRSFWMWAVPLLAVHGLVSIAMAKGVQGPLGPIDTALIILFAAALAGRFRDIGWPVWIGPSLVIVTLLVIPFVAFGYAIASHPAPAEFLQWLVRIGQVTGPLNLLLLVVAGCVPGPTQGQLER
jgi:hypothetical protein